MYEKPLLLPSVRAAVLVSKPRRSRTHFVRLAAVAIGLFCVMVGTADVASKVSDNVLGGDAAIVAFGPIVALNTTASTSQDTFVPARLAVPSVGISANVERVGKGADGSMATPSSFTNVGWYAMGARPGEPGSAVFDGHVNNALTTAGVFANLAKVREGDYVTVTDQRGRTLVYKVDRIEELAFDAPTDPIFTTSGPSQLVLITCDGEWVQDSHQFNKRLVVFASLAY